MGYLVPNPDVPERMMCVPSCVVFAPCPLCKAPIGVPCRGSLGDWIDKGMARGRWWRSDCHYARGDLWKRTKRLDPETRASVYKTYPTDMERRTNFGKLVDPGKLMIYESKIARSNGSPVRLPAAQFHIFKSERAARYRHLPRFNWRLEIRGKHTCNGPGYDSLESTRSAIYLMSKALSGAVAITHDGECQIEN